MKSYRRLREHSWLLVIMLCIITFLSAGCSSSSTTSSNNVNPLGAYQPENPTSGISTDGAVKNPGQIDSPIISLPPEGGGIDSHSNAPLLDNMHPGWQQAACLSCHSNTSRNPDHNYTDDNLCYLCHGTNGLPGFADNIPPIISGVVAAPTQRTAMFTWTTDKECLSRLVLRTKSGDRLEFPVSTTYKKSHRYEVSGLQPSTSYSYEISNTDRSGNRTTSATFGTLSFTTLEAQTTEHNMDAPPAAPETELDPFFRDINIREDGPFSVNMSFTTRELARVRVYFLRPGTDQMLTVSNVTEDVYNGAPRDKFDFNLAGLQGSTEYDVILEGRDSNDKTFRSRRYNFTTEPL